MRVFQLCNARTESNKVLAGHFNSGRQPKIATWAAKTGDIDINDDDL